MDLTTVNNGRYTVSYIKDDAYIGPCIARGYEWDGWMRDDISTFYKKGTDILDIGGNIGYNSLMFSDYGPVHTFEPVFHEIININAKQNSLRNPINVYPYGLSSKVDSLKIYRPKIQHVDKTNYGGYSMTFSEGHLEDDYTVVDVKRLDDVYDGVPSVIKIDIEGHEEEFLKGARETITTHKPVLLIEIHDWERDKMFPILKDLGYTTLYQRPEKIFTCVFE